jgi:Flp pilus assembly protein TadG
MIRGHQARESGQALVEFAFVILALFILSIGLVDVGRYFYEYNALAAAARYGARFAAVTGGTCSESAADLDTTTSDWCNQFISGSTTPPGGSWNHAPPTGANGAPTFWTLSGNWPLQSGGTSCPFSITPSFNGYYRASDFTSSTSSSIVGVISQRFDTNSTSGGSGGSSLIVGGLTPGFDAQQMKVCIQLTWSGVEWQWTPGSKVTVFVYYPFTPVSGILAHGQIQVVASSTYEME